MNVIELWRSIPGPIFLKGYRKYQLPGASETMALPFLHEYTLHWLRITERVKIKKISYGV